MSKSKGSKAKRVKVHISLETAAALGADDDLDAAVEEILRAHIARDPGLRGSKTGRVASFFQELAGPHLETIGKDVAAKVAKDVATAAAAAALAAWVESSARKKNAPKPDADQPSTPAAGGPDA